MSQKPTREEVRAAMSSDMRDFIDAWREIDPEVKISSLYTPKIALGTPGPHALSVADMVIREKVKK